MGATTVVFFTWSVNFKKPNRFIFIFLEPLKTSFLHEEQITDPEATDTSFSAKRQRNHKIKCFDSSLPSILLLGAPKLRCMQKLILKELTAQHILTIQFSQHS